MYLNTQDLLQDDIGLPDGSLFYVKSWQDLRCNLLYLEIKLFYTNLVDKIDRRRIEMYYTDDVTLEDAIEYADEIYSEEAMEGLMQN